MEKQIKLDEKSAQEFVSAASRCNFDIDVFYNRIIIDAKSILGPVSYTHLGTWRKEGT